jgi:hypothetical protein
MTEQYYGWRVAANEKKITLTHEESGHGFEFDRKESEPFFVVEKFFADEVEDSEIAYDDLVDRAFEIAYDYASRL